MTSHSSPEADWLPRTGTMILDIETTPRGAMALRAERGDDWYRLGPPGFVPVPYPAFEYGGAPKNYKNQEKIDEHRAKAEAAHKAGEATWDGGLKDAWDEWRKRSLIAHEAEIVCLGYALDDGPVQMLTGDVIPQLAAVIKVHEPRIVTAWNVEFDLGVVHALALRDGTPEGDRLAGLLAPYPYQIRAALKLFGGPLIVDAMDLYAGGRRTKLEAVASLLGVPPTEHPIRGAEVFDAVMGGRLDDVIAHCRSDVEDLRAVWRRLYGAAMVRR